MSRNNSSSSSSSSSSASLSSIRSSLTEAQKQKLDKQLIEAAKIGDPETIKKLVQQGADVNAVNNYGWAALHFASRYGHTAAAQLLINNRANVNTADNYSRTALHEASINGHNETAQLLINNRANVNTADNYGETALLLASINGHTTIAQLLIDNGANVHAVNNGGRTALLLASFYGKTAIAQLLINNGANVYLAGENLSNISDLVSLLKQAHGSLEDICLKNGNEQGGTDPDKKMDLIRSKLLAKYPNLAISPLDAEGNTILNLIADKIVNPETGEEEKDNLLRLFTKLAVINSSEFKRNVTTNIIATNGFIAKDPAKIIANYSVDKKGAINPIDKLLAFNNSLQESKRNDPNVVKEEILNYSKKNEIDPNLAQAFFLAEVKNYWQDAVKHYPQASSSSLGQNTASAAASSSSSSSFTAGSSNNNATKRSGKDEASSSSSYSSAAAAAKGSSSSSIPPETDQENRDLQAAINASLQDLERQPLAATAASAVSISSGITLSQITSTYPSHSLASSSLQDRNRANLPNDNLASSNPPSSSSSSSNSKKSSFFSRLFSCSSPQTDDAGERPFSSQPAYAAARQPLSSPSNPEGKGTAANKKGQGK